MITEQDKERMREACDIAKFSDDTKCKVGAVSYGMTNKKEGMRYFSHGYNGVPISYVKAIWDNYEWGAEDRELFYKKISEDGDLKRLFFHHAEACVHASKKHVHLNVLYVTKFPCYKCCRSIEEQGFKRIVTAPIYTPSKWEVTQKEGLHYLTRSDVIVDFIEITMIDGQPHLTEDLPKKE